jgi:ParB-like chromosome segregation protein Spo0J
MNNLFESAISEHLEKICSLLDLMPLEDRVEALNAIRQRLHDASPFADEPVDCVLWVEADSVRGNDYNPNRVAPPEMRLLEHSMVADGITQPIVAYAEAAAAGYTVIDGFHRTRVCKECRKLRERLYDYIPVSTINDRRHDIKDRMAATIRHNRARGVHGVIPMVDIVAMLIRQGWTDGEIAKELGMDADEVLRFKQSSGLPELFKDHEYSRAWE